ncbi:NAD(P)-binding protein [Leucogyrophana mollusca]|uniref:NAD(P)-binding protein n=1 Tax=Leucogyrophana mollusca TaxID=85980 RepID=A0ACB8BJ47_9AGAM|nr:NAD(P)-binding protein [Leucogyrophana mollusca]
MSKGIAIVTGAAQGIGHAVALRLAHDGFDVAVNDLRAKEEQLQALALKISANGCRSCVVSADVSIESEVKRMVQRVTEELGGLDVMVANAGIAQVGSLLESTGENWDSIFEVNAKGVFLCYKYAAIQMITQGRGGRIMGASSMAGKRGLLAGVAYSATKFAVRGLTQAAALELGSHGITVNSYAPGIIDTPMMDSIRIQRGRDDSGKDRVQRVIDNSAVGYPGQPDDVASLVSYLASKEAHFITGQSVSVDGGIVLS